jgi:mono/diheme cytochrome c family protein
MSTRVIKRVASIGIACLVSGACGGGEPASPAAAEAKKVWKDKCVTCHGETGLGNGPGAMALDPKPRSFRDPTWQAQTDDARIRKVIVEGGAAVGLSPGMAPNPELTDKPEVVTELLALVRSFQ